MPTAALSSADEEDAEEVDEPAQPAWVEMAQPLVAPKADDAQYDVLLVKPYSLRELLDTVRRLARSQTD